MQSHDRSREQTAKVEAGSAEVRSFGVLMSPSHRLTGDLRRQRQGRMPDKGALK